MIGRQIRICTEEGKGGINRREKGCRNSLGETGREREEKDNKIGGLEGVIKGENRQHLHGKTL